MKHIFQHYKSDCFPTCIAMIAGISHRQALQLVHPSHKKGKDYLTFDARGIKILRLLGFKVRKRYIKNFNKLKQNAILIVSYNENDKIFDHVVVWDAIEKRILDPAPLGSYLPLSFYKKYFVCALIIS